jgi:hypothetical protein
MFVYVLELCKSEAKWPLPRRRLAQEARDSACLIGASFRPRTLDACTQAIA